MGFKTIKMIILKPNSSTSEVYAALLIKTFVKKDEKIIVREATKTELSIGGVPTVGFNSKPVRWNFADCKANCTPAPFVKAYKMAIFHLKLRKHINSDIAIGIENWISMLNEPFIVMDDAFKSIEELESSLTKFIDTWITTS